MTLLAYMDGSQWSVHALRYLANGLGPTDRLVLLHVVPRGGISYLECGRMLLEVALQQCRLRPDDARLCCRLDVGDPADHLLAVCREERPDVLALGVVGAGEFPRLVDLGELVQTVRTAAMCPILLASPRGIELLAADERLLIVPRVPRPKPAVAERLPSVTQTQALPVPELADRSPEWVGA